MKNAWSKAESSEFIAKYGDRWGESLALRTYSSQLLGAEKTLVLHGGGNTSVKDNFVDVLGRVVPGIFVKASGHDLATIEPEGHVAIRLGDLCALRDLPELSDKLMVNEIRTKLFDATAPTPSIEALMHAFIPSQYVDHTHADAILALTNQPNGRHIVRQALGKDVIVVDYFRPGFELAKAAAHAFELEPKSRAMVLMKHGLVTWGETARESYERTVNIVTQAEEYLAKNATKTLTRKAATSLEQSRERYLRIAPVLRGLMAVRTADMDCPYHRFILRPLLTKETLDLVDGNGGREMALTPPLVSDHLVRTKALPLWIDAPQYDDTKKLMEQISHALAKYRQGYDAYVQRHANRLPKGLQRFDSTPRVVLMPGLGVVCAGKDVAEAEVVRDITARTLSVKAQIAAVGEYEGLNEQQLFDMEYHRLQHSKLDSGAMRPLRRSVALVTGAAGALGSAICEELLKAGCHVAASDLPGDRLTSFADRLEQTYGARVTAVPLDVTDKSSVASGYDQVVQTWGGTDLVIANAGLAHVSSLADMESQAFTRLQKVNLEGTLHILAEAARRFKIQGTGGDIVLISTKNVFAPGARFGAYSATKSAAHQLARVASLELAEIDVRVNMVSPDAVFAHGDTRSGLWAEVGPDRMRARDLDERGLEEYYRKRNLLKVPVTAEHVARAVLFFATRQAPNTGATLPVDGGLPDATPR